MTTSQNEWDAWLSQMEQLLALELDDTRRAELRVQFSRIAAMAGPLMAFPLDERVENRRSL
ncbi:Uncharacterised protein [Klebsiella oxytoca]|nr:Uncharacterised protein [Klebsiella oxytoca]